MIAEGMTADEILDGALGSSAPVTRGVAKRRKTGRP
jgi:hypothetical protein